MRTRATVWTFYRLTAELGWRWFVRGLDYSRCYEYPAAYNALGLCPNCRVLDIGSASYSLFPLYMAAERRYEVHFTDKDPYVEKHWETLERLGINRGQVPAVFVGTEDAQRLSYPDNHFDRICSISTIEHIPIEGDTLAMKEIGRTLRPGGIAVISVPCAPRHCEEYVDEAMLMSFGLETRFRDLFRQRRLGRKAFFQRRYDERSLQERLVRPSGLAQKDMWYFEERLVRFSHWWAKRHPVVKALSNWLNPFFCHMFLRTRRGEMTEQVEGAVLVLSKGESSL